MVIIEIFIFIKFIIELMNDDEYKDLQEVFVSRLDRGVIIKNSGGLRKVCWVLEGRGKSGGVRVIYYWMIDND